MQAYVITQSHRTLYTSIGICRLFLEADDIDRFLRHSTCHHSHHHFVLTTAEPSLRKGQPSANAWQPTPFWFERTVTHRIHRGKGGGAREARKIREFGALPFPSPITLATQAASWRPHSSVPRFLPNLVVITGIVLKRKVLQAFSVISVQVRIFTGLDRNGLK